MRGVSKPISLPPPVYPAAVLNQMISVKTVGPVMAVVDVVLMHAVVVVAVTAALGEVSGVPPVTPRV